MTEQERLADPTLAPETPERFVPEDSTVLARAAAMRFPVLRELEGGLKIDALIDYITDTAIMRGELEELRLGTHVKLLDLQQQWNALGAPTNKTQPQVEAFRRALRPDLAVQVEGARWVIARCTEQIVRLGGSDYDAASRAYTLLGG